MGAWAFGSQTPYPACTQPLPVQDLAPKQAAAPASAGARTSAGGSAAKAKDKAVAGQAKGDKGPAKAKGDKAKGDKDAKAASGGRLKRLRRAVISDDDEEEAAEGKAAAKAGGVAAMEGLEDELEDAGEVQQGHADTRTARHTHTRSLLACLAACLFLQGLGLMTLLSLLKRGPPAALPALPATLAGPWCVCVHHTRT